jgi:hypothetical protein
VASWLTFDGNAAAITEPKKTLTALNLKIAHPYALQGSGGSPVTRPNQRAVGLIGCGPESSPYSPPSCARDRLEPATKAGARHCRSPQSISAAADRRPVTRGTATVIGLRQSPYQQRQPETATQ